MARNYRLHNPHDPSGPHTRSSLPQVTLEIIRGRARQRIRPIVRPAFLIGSAADSDLMLGSQAFPTAHCYLLLNPEGVGLRWLGFAPEVLVNDRAVEKAELQDGDVLRTGPYEFRIRIRRGDSMLRLSHPSEADAEHPANDSSRGSSSGPQNLASHEIDGLLNDIRRAFGLGLQTAALKLCSPRETRKPSDSRMSKQEAARPGDRRCGTGNRAPQLLALSVLVLKAFTLTVLVLRTTTKLNERLIVAARDPFFGPCHEAPQQAPARHVS